MQRTTFGIRFGMLGYHSKDIFSYQKLETSKLVYLTNHRWLENSFGLRYKQQKWIKFNKKSRILVNLGLLVFHSSHERLQELYKVRIYQVQNAWLVNKHGFNSVSRLLLLPVFLWSFWALTESIRQCIHEKLVFIPPEEPFPAFLKLWDDVREPKNVILACPVDVR